MRKVNTNELAEETWSSPKGKFCSAGKEVSEALGRKPQSTDLKERHPFDVEICRIPKGKAAYPYHSHSMQWEFYHVISGIGVVRHEDGTTHIGPGDAFIFQPGQAHQITSDPEQDLVLYVVADNPFSESTHYPDSGKWIVRSPERKIVIPAAHQDYYEGEEQDNLVCAGQKMKGARPNMASGSETPSKGTHCDLAGTVRLDGIASVRRNFILI